MVWTGREVSESENERYARRVDGASLAILAVVAGALIGAVLWTAAQLVLHLIHLGL